MKKFMKENYLNSNIKLNRFNGFLSVKLKKYIKIINLISNKKLILK